MYYKTDPKDLLLDALKALVKTQPLEKISVQKILDKSGVSRTTFYRHFPDKYALVQYYYAKHVEEIIQNEGEYYSWKSINRQIVQFYEENKEYYRNVIKYNDQNNYNTFVVDFGVGTISSVYRRNTHSEDIPPDITFYIELYNAGGYYMMQKWLRNELDLTAEEFAQLRYDALPQVLKDIVR